MMETVTVSTSSIVAMVVTLILMAGTPFLAGVICAKVRKFNGIAILAGFLSFTVMQLVIRINILNAVSTLPGFAQFVDQYKWLYFALLAVTASLFEGAGRLLTARYIVRPRRYTAGNALAHGVAHGGIESLILGATTYVNNIVFAVMINMGQMNALASQLGAEQVNAVAVALGQTPVWLFLIAGVERVLTIGFHIGLSVLAFHSLKTRSVKSALLMFGLHAAVDFIAPGIASLQSLDMVVRTLLSEFVVLLFAAASLFIAARIVRNWNDDAPAAQQPDADSVSG